MGSPWLDALDWRRSCSTKSISAADLNIWIPLQQVRVRPLALMDVQTFNRSAPAKVPIVNKFMSDHEDGEGGKEKYLLNDCFTSLHHMRTRNGIFMMARTVTK